MILICKNCKKEFICEREKRKYCSHECYVEQIKIGNGGFNNKKHTEVVKKSISLKKIGIPNPTLKVNRFDWNGKKHTKESREKQSLSAIKKFKNGFRQWNKIGENGITTENNKCRQTKQYLKWRDDVFERDNWTCQKTGIRGGFLHPHHIKNFSDYPELRHDIENGITLSRESHKLFHHIYGTKHNTDKQIKEFLSTTL